MIITKEILEAKIAKAEQEWESMVAATNHKLGELNTLKHLRELAMAPEPPPAAPVPAPR